MCHLQSHMATGPLGLASALHTSGAHRPLLPAGHNSLLQAQQLLTELTGPMTDSRAHAQSFQTARDALMRSSTQRRQRAQAVDFRRVWWDRGARNATRTGLSIWRPVPPVGYVALGASMALLQVLDLRHRALGGTTCMQPGCTATSHAIIFLLPCAESTRSAVWCVCRHRQSAAKNHGKRLLIVSLWRFAIAGDCLGSGYDPPRSVTVLLDSLDASDSPLLRLADDLDLVWRDETAGADKCLCLWRPRAPARSAITMLCTQPSLPSPGCSWGSPVHKVIWLACAGMQPWASSQASDPVSQTPTWCGVSGRCSPVALSDCCNACSCPGVLRACCSSPPTATGSRTVQGRPVVA